MNSVRKKISGWLKHSKVAENYFFMTFLQGAGILIGLLLYPYLIRVMGGRTYGTYVFVLSNIQFFISFITFGFTFPALKKIALNPDDTSNRSQTVSEVFTGKCLLLGISALFLGILMATIPFVQRHAALYGIIFVSTLTDILFPTWFFRGIQKMKFVTFVNLSLRILTIPFIFICVKSPDDLLKYAFIVSIFPVFGGIFTVFYLHLKENTRLYFVKFRDLKPIFRDAMPFFWTDALGTFKQEAVTFIIGTFFSMKEVALYDLANKIIMIPRLITTNINAALFPNVVRNLQRERILKIIRYERWIGLSITGAIIATGYWVVWLLGGKAMLEAYPIAVLLSITIYAWLVVGCYINYLFVPQNRYYFVTQNQLGALISFLAFVAIALFVFKNLLLVILAYTLSHFIEIFYCRYLIKKHQLL